MLDICYQILKTGVHDVRWEKVELIKRILTGGTYSVPPGQVAARLLERMLESDPANHRWNGIRSGATNVSSGVCEATRAGNGTKTIRRKTRRVKKGPTGKVTCHGIFGGWELTGWRYLEDATWHVKVWPVGRPSGWIGYRVAVGIFELKTVAQAHKEAILYVIREWESELDKT